MDRVGVGVIGCGVISAAYLKAARHFPILDVRAVADLNPAAAEARGSEFGLPAVAIDDLLADPAIEIVLNLTIPKAHVAVSLAGSSRPASTSIPRSRSASTSPRAGASSRRPTARGLRVGCAPDTFLGGAHQTCRKLIDEGAIGTPRRRHRLLHVPRPRALAPGTRLLLRGRRRADARHGPLLHHRSRQPARPRRRGRGDGLEAARRARIDHQRAAARPSRCPSHVPTHAAAHAALRHAGAVVQVSLSFDVWAAPPHPASRSTAPRAR